MARTDNLINYFTDIANSIRTKKGYESTQKISADEFDIEIGSISTINNQHITITENGTYTPSGNYTGFDQVIVDVDSIPDGIFIQGTQPAKTTSEAVWLQNVDKSKASQQIPIEYTGNGWHTSNTSVSGGSSTDWTWGDILSFMTEEQIALFDSYAYHILIHESYNSMDYITLVASNTMYKPTSSNILGTSGATIVVRCNNTFSGGNKTANVTTPDGYILDRSYKLFAWENIYIQNSSTIAYASDVVNSEDDLEISIDANTKYLIYMNKANTWNKILDTSVANAIASNILTGKTAFVNNTKITGTMPNNGALDITPTTSEQSLPLGYISGGKIRAVDRSYAEVEHPLDYTVENVSGSTYKFIKNSNNYYESNNQGVSSSYAICKFVFTAPEVINLTFDVISSGESESDFGIFSDLDTTLSLSNSEDTTNVKKSYKGQPSTTPVQLTYANVSAGSHFIYIKYRKDNSRNSGNDSLQFKCTAMILPTSKVYVVESLSKITSPATGDYANVMDKNNINKGMVTYKYNGSSWDKLSVDTSDADAVANDIAQGKTAYVNDVKLTGTNPLADSTTYNNLVDLTEQILGTQGGV